MKNKGEILNRLKNTGTIVAIASASVMIATNLGFDIDSEKVLYIINTICSVGVALGVLNNPTTSGLDNPMKK
ncbi:phage holin [Paraclostridium bifermentans]|uniref:phage holin n=1 Tax=Paraclostridium bifermentans TaxID=1490 RepID=UPI001F472DC9|nr:phage holin [Paraclostridium bifermentans]MCE9675450.1 phage holin [Paraclostridium bifermentans]